MWNVRKKQISSSLIDSKKKFNSNKNIKEESTNPSSKKRWKWSREKTVCKMSIELPEQILISKLRFCRKLNLTSREAKTFNARKPKCWTPDSLLDAKLKSRNCSFWKLWKWWRREDNSTKMSSPEWASTSNLAPATGWIIRCSRPISIAAIRKTTWITAQILVIRLTGKPKYSMVTNMPLRHRVQTTPFQLANSNSWKNRNRRRSLSKSKRTPPSSSESLKSEEKRAELSK